MCSKSSKTPEVLDRKHLGGACSSAPPMSLFASTSEVLSVSTPDVLFPQPLRPVKRHRHFPGVRDPMQYVARAVHHRPRADFGDLAGALDDARAGRDDHE